MRVRAAVFIAAIFLILPTLQAAETVLIGGDAQWKYYSSPTPPPENWKAPAFNAETWSSGPAQLGYGDGDEATVIPGGEINPHPVAAYFRRSFSVADPSTLSKLVFRLLRDDGAVVYLNGVEVVRSNMPDGVITPNTLASVAVGADAENLFIAYDVPASALAAGENVVAVEVHQVNVSSSDLSFALQIIGVSGDTQPPPRPVVSIAASQPQTAEPGPTIRVVPGKFTISRSGTGNNDAALPVYLRYDGTATPEIDYEALPTRVEIPAGASSTELLVIAKADNLTEPSETVVAKISEPPTNPDSIPYSVSLEHPSATVTIADTPAPTVPVLSIEATTAVTSEPIPNALIAPGVFTIRRSAPADTSFTAWIAVGGMAQNGVDYESVPNQVQFASGQTEATIKILPKSDELVEGDETVVAELSQPPTAGAVLFYTINPDKRRAVVTIKDEDKPAPARVEITSPTQGAILRVGSTVTVNATAVDPEGYIPRVEFFSDGVSIGVSEIAFLIAPDPGTPIYHSIEWKNIPIGDHVLSAKGVRANGETVASSEVKVHVVVVDPPPRLIVSIRKVEDQTERPIPNADYASDFFEISRVGPTNEALQVYFRAPQDGEHIATPEVDYKRLVSPVTIPAGETNVFMRVEAIDDELVEGTEIVRIALTPVPSTVDPATASNYVIDSEHASADVAILDNDQPAQQVVLAVSVADGIASEVTTTGALDTAMFVIKRIGGPSDVAVTALYELSGVAQNGVDYKTLSGKVELPAGAMSAQVEVVAIPDNLEEGEESVILTVVPPACIAIAPPPPDCYLVGDARSGRAVILDKRDDRPKVTITKPADGAVFHLGETIDIEAKASDREGVISKLEILADAELLGSATDPKDYLLVHWTGAKVGEHTIVAHVVDGSGQDAMAIIHITVGPLIEITSPKNDATLVEGITIPVKATAIDPDGYIARLEFFSDDVSIGVSEIVFIVAPEPGTPIYHSIEWRNIPLGDHVLTAKGVRANGEVTVSPGVKIHVIHSDPPPRQVVLGVQVMDGIASEVTTTDAFDTAVILIKRLAGPENVGVTARYELSGTAQNGIDYEKLTGTVELPAGVASAAVKIVAIPDNLEEGEETVILTLVPANCPIAAGTVPPPECYLVGEAKTGRAVIVDRRDAAPGVKILHPVNGAVFSLAQVIEIEAQAWDREGIISKLEILADGKQLGQTDDDHLVVRWTDAALGDHVIVAHAVDGSGQESKTEIRIRVREQSADAFVFRKLPPAYTPGTTFGVELRAEPPAGASAYAVEDQPPTGWQVSSISHEGVFDAATGKVKFGPFTDTTARTLSYKLTPPAPATGRKEFAGVGSVDGVNYRIGGDRIIEQSQTEHPADTDKNFVVNVAELTAYAAAWKRGEDVPLSYLTRAGFIWKHGEAYKFDGSHEPPFCWVPLQTIDDGGVVRVASLVESERVGSGETKPGVSANFEVRIVPPAGTSAYAVEEKIPLGWAVSNISHDGTVDAATGIIRWGVFFDATARTLSYTLMPPPGVTALARLGGRVSFDGATYEISGCEKTTSTDSTTLPTIGKCESDGSKVRLELSGGAGQVGVLQCSTDLVHWQDVATLFLPDGIVQFDDDASTSGVKYYRLQGGFKGHCYRSSVQDRKSSSPG